MFVNTMLYTSAVIIFCFGGYIIYYTSTSSSGNSEAKEGDSQHHSVLEDNSFLNLSSPSETSMEENSQTKNINASSVLRA
jgi:hypothetical protein